MKVLFVCNNAFNPGNGLSASALSTIKRLRENGVDARLMAVSNPNPDGPQPDFPLKHFKFPVFEPIIAYNGFCFATIDYKIIRKAVEWADVVHFEEALFLEEAVMSVAKKMGKACVATFHLYPHNITANLGLPKRNLVNSILLFNWKHLIFNKCSDIMCPTEVVRKYLADNGYKSRLHVCSNGTEVTGERIVTKPYGEGEVINILSIGRLANEKSQNTLIDAVRHSKYARRIRLQFAGNGPKARKYHRMAEKLYNDGVVAVKPEFGFYDHAGLDELARKSYLYIHTAWVEVEGLSCLDATRVGAVPVIAEGDLIGTTVFALCPESLFPEYDSKALAERIDWWIEHPQERDRYSQLYADAARKYDVKDSIAAHIRMYEMAISDNQTSRR